MRPIGLACLCLAGSILSPHGRHLSPRRGAAFAPQHASVSLPTAAQLRGDDDERDPCTLVTRHEAEAHLGPLLHDPYRSNPNTGLRAIPDGETCLYRARDGHSIEIRPQWAEGQTTMALYDNSLDMMNSVLKDEPGQLDTLGGDWDDMRWVIGDLFVLKGDTIVEVDVAASRAGPAGAIDLARHAMERLTKPLVYDGAAAGRTAPGPMVEPRDPCRLLTRQEAEVFVGTITSAPVSTADGCTYPVVPQVTGVRAIELHILWSGGFKKMFQAKWAGKQALAGIGGAASEQEANTPGVQKAVDQLNAVLGRTTSRDKLTLTADTASLVGPWDEARVTNGVELSAVSKDVYMQIDLRTLPLDKSRALMAAAMAKL